MNDVEDVYVKRNLITLGLVALVVAAVVFANRFEPDRADERHALNLMKDALKRAAPPRGYTLDGAKFLVENSRRPGVKSLASGLQFEVLREGTGEKLLPYHNIKMHYRGTFQNGNEFDSSYAKGGPKTTMFRHEITALQFALSRMRVGDKWMVYAPPTLAYKDVGLELTVPPNTLVIFEVDVLEIVGIDADLKISYDENKARGENILGSAQSTTAPQENIEAKDVVQLPSGLQYVMIRKGTGASPKLADRVRTHYKGTFTDGREFDSSYSRGEPTVFAVGRVIPAWTEALQLMKEGGKWRLFVPPELAYGAAGAPPKIPPNTALIFEIELIEIVR